MTDRKSLRGFITEHGLPYGTTRKWLLENGHDTSNGLDKSAQDAALANFQPQQVAESAPAETALIKVSAAGQKIVFPSQQKPGNAEDLFRAINELRDTTGELPTKKIAFSGLEDYENAITQRLSQAVQKRQGLNSAINLVAERSRRLEELVALKQQAEEFDAENRQLEERVVEAAQLVKEAELELEPSRR